MARTREQDRTYQRDYRKRKAVEAREESGITPTTAGRTRELVERELETLRAASRMASAVGIALAMADVLDDPAAVPQHPAAAGQLRQIMSEIRSAKAPAGESALQMIRGGRTG